VACRSYTQGALYPSEGFYGALHPFQKPTARRYQRNIETLVDISLALGGVISVRVDDDRAVAVDAPAEEIGEVRLGDRERAEGQALCRREADGKEPVVEGAVAPLQAVNEPSVVLVPDDSVAESKTRSEGFEQIVVLRGDGEMAPVTR